jgi:hypothetical protein
LALGDDRVVTEVVLLIIDVDSVSWVPHPESTNMTAKTVGRAFSVSVLLGIVVTSKLRILFGKLNKSLCECLHCSVCFRSPIALSAQSKLLRYEDTALVYSIFLKRGLEKS